MPDAVTTLGVALDDATRALAAVSPTPRLDAETLLMHVLNAGRTALITHSEEKINPDRLDRLRDLVNRRQAGEPIAYIVGTREFWSLPLNVTPAVLIPRPETELLVERALEHIPRDADYNIADLGTGSGAIALAIAHERPHCRVVGTDVSADALSIAQKNARALDIVNVEFRCGDWLRPVAHERFHVIASNPPYIRTGDVHLHQGDLRFEPPMALVSGHDGLDAIRRITANVEAHLHGQGWLILEHGYDQADAVAAILKTAGFRDIVSHNDLAGHTRITEARRS